MKKTYATVFCIFIICKVFAQTYHPLIRPNITWNVMVTNAQSWCNYAYGNSYHFEGDTTIAGKVYQLITANPIVSLTPSNPPYEYCAPYAVDKSRKLDKFGGYYSALLREDVAAKKVFIYEQNYGELLLYDFNLNAGDTLKSSAEGGLRPFVVDSVKQIALLNGELRKKFYLKNPLYPSHPPYYIEGIGGSQGLQFHMDSPAFGFGSEHEPTCFLEDKTALWGNKCIGTVGIAQLGSDKLINVFPNPAVDMLQIEQPAAISSILYILDLTGRVLISEKLIHEKQSIDVSALNAGAYLYSIENNGQRKNGNFVVVK